MRTFNSFEDDFLLYKDSMEDTVYKFFYDVFKEEQVAVRCTQESFDLMQGVMQTSKTVNIDKDSMLNDIREHIVCFEKLKIFCKNKLKGTTRMQIQLFLGEEPYDLFQLYFIDNVDIIEISKKYCSGKHTVSSIYTKLKRIVVRLQQQDYLPVA